jgi:RNA polymerase sigma-70 factor, ECF subfamily
VSAVYAERVRERRTPGEAYAAELYQRHNRAIFRHCLRLLRRREDADDATQTTFIYALLNLRRGVVPEAELPWLYTIAGHVCSSQRRTGQRRGLLEQARDLDTLQDALPSPERQTPATADDFRMALRAIPDNQRSALLLREWQGLSYSEIASQLGLSNSATETLLFRARRNLAEKLQEKTGHRTVNGLSFLPLIQSLFQRAAATTAVVGLGAAATIAGVPSATPHSAATQVTAPKTIISQHVSRDAGSTSPSRVKPTPHEAPRSSRSTRLTAVDRSDAKAVASDADAPQAPVSGSQTPAPTNAEAAHGSAPPPATPTPTTVTDVPNALPPLDLPPPDAVTSAVQDAVASPLETVQTVVQGANLPVTLPALPGSMP